MISQALFTSEQPKKNKMAFVAIFLQIKLVFGLLVIQLVWYIWNATGLVCGSLTGFECFVACDCVYSLDFLFEKREVVSTIVRVFDEFIGA